MDNNKNLSTVVNSKGILYQIGDSLKTFTSKEELQKNIEKYQNREKFLCNISLNRDLYDIEMTEEEKKETISMNNNDVFNNINLDIDNIPWIISKYVFDNNQEHGYKLHKGDIFKLGKYILRVKEIGIEDDKKHFFFENKNTQKYIRKSLNNASQIPLNQHGENYFSALNLNKIINVQRKDENDNNAIENGSNNNENNIKNESESNNKENSKNNSGNDNSNNNNNFVSIINLNQNNNENNDNQILNNKSQKVISIYYSNYSGNNNSHSHNYNEIISNNGSNNNVNINNGNHYFINIINNNNNNNIDNNNNILDDSKNKINNNSLGFHTFHNNSIIYSSGKNISFKNVENENENSKNNLNININLHNNNYQINKNSIKALGSTASFKIKKLTDIIHTRISKNTISIADKNNKPICRICLSEEYEENNPLIHPCNCDGTMKYIHLQCLRLLIQSKIKKTETESCKVFTFKTLECEICKMVFPEKIRIKGSIFSIIDLEKPDKDYLILDGLIKEIPEEKSIFIVHFKNKKEIKIGRATDANIRLSDISVSRAHAIITQYNDNFYLHDTNSKFGTLISAGNKFCILYNKPFCVQKGNILFEFLMKKTFCAILRCYRPSIILYKTYNDFLDEIFLYKYQYKEEELLIYEKTKTVSEYSSNIIIKQNHINAKSSKNINLFENDNNKENNEESKEYNNISNSKSNNSNIKGDKNNNQQYLFDSFRVNKGNNIDGNYNSIGVNKTQEISNIYHKNDNIKSNLDNNGNENSLFFNKDNINDKV